MDFKNYKLHEGVKFIENEEVGEALLINVPFRCYIKVPLQGARFVKSFFHLSNKEKKSKLKSLSEKDREGFYALLGKLADEKYICEECEITDKDDETPVKDLEKSVYLSISDVCNMSCRFCYANPKRKNERYSGNTNLTFKIIEALSDLNTKVVVITGGEPLLREDCIEIISYCVEKIDRVMMTTNGILIDKKLAKELKKTGIHDISISLQSTKEELQDYLRGEGTYKKVMEALDNLKEAGFTKEQLTFTPTLTKYNWENLKNFSDFAEKMGVKYNFSLYQPVGRGEHTKYMDMMINMSEYFDLVYDIVEKSKNATGFSEQQFENEIFTGVLPNIKTGCGMAKSMLGVHENGDAVPCHLFLGKNEFIIGNVLDPDFVEKMESFHTPSIDEVKGCNSCDMRYFCGGGCMGPALINTGEFGPSPYCRSLNHFYSVQIWNAGHRGGLREYEEQIKEVIQVGKHESTGGTNSQYNE